MSSDSNVATILHVDHLEKVYRGGSFLRRGNVHALNGVSLRANAGEVFGLLGPNGAGKTTLIKILLGVIRSTGGHASLFGLPAGSSAARQRVGYLPESLRVDRHHTARSALKYYGRLSRLDSLTIGRRSDELLKLVGLDGRDRESVKRFSKGMLQRLGLAQALMHDPDLLILDEPTDGLDPVGRSEVRRVLERLRDEGKTIFLNSHILHEVEMVCSHLAIMAKGRVLATGPIADLAGGGENESSITIDLAFKLPGEPSVEANEDDQSGELESDRTGSSDGAGSRDPMGLMEQLSLLGRVDAPFAVNPLEANSRHGRLICDDQAAVDRVVDTIRGLGGSLLRLQPVRQTLEDKFMRLVNSAEQSSPAGEMPERQPS